MFLLYFVLAIIVVALLINLFKNDDELNLRTLKYFSPAFLIVAILFLLIYFL
tara:strand:+ start:132 stop:287 length:156 start_codon:yes stop_codon:yes gene_type:complete